MLAKSFFASALLATSALAAPTISNCAPAELEKRADWQEGKREAHIFVDGKSMDTLPSYHSSLLHKHHSRRLLHQRLGSALDCQHHRPNGIGSMINLKNPPVSERVVDTSKGLKFSFKGEPARIEAQDVLTFRYNDREWNSVDCYKYTYEHNLATDSQKTKHNWWCQSDC